MNVDDTRTPWDACTPIGGLPESERQVVDPTQMAGVIDVWLPELWTGNIALEDDDRVLSWTPQVDGANTIYAGTGSPERPTFLPRAFTSLYPGVQFDGVANALTGATPASAWGSDVTLVFAAQSAGTSGVIVEYSDAGFVSSPDSFAVTAGSGRTNAYIGTPTDGFYFTNGLLQPTVVSVRVTRATPLFQFRVNGSDVGPAAAAAPPAHVPGGTVAFSFGGSQSGPQFWGGIIGRVAVFNRVLTGPEVLDVERWAALGTGVSF